MEDNTEIREGDALPPKSNHQTDRGGNGTTQRMGPRFETDLTLNGLYKSTIELMDRVANGEMDVAEAKAALGYNTNATNQMKQKISVIRSVDKASDQVLELLASEVLDQQAGERFRAVVDEKHKQRQITRDKPSGTGSDKPHQN